MNCCGIYYCDTANGVGIRTSLYVSGCTHHCKGCFNEATWDFSYGTEWNEAAERELFSALAPDHIRGLSVLGGEPFEPANAETVAKIICKVKERNPGKDIWCYSGGVYETELSLRAKTEPAVAAILENIDVLVDGPFVEERKNLRLAFRGSDNQRILNMEEVRKGNIVSDKNYQ